MAFRSIIAWTEHTWNPWRGCTKISPGCKFCYMFTAQERYGRDPRQVVRTKTWDHPIRWQRDAEAEGRTAMVFTCSWSDWYHVDADPWRPEAWDLIRRTPNLHYQILTKRDDRIRECLPYDWGHDGYPNAWLGVSVEDRKHLYRVDSLRDVPAVVRFLSVEPLLEDLGEIDLAGIDWVIVGGESGNHMKTQKDRWMELAWARSIRDQCDEAGVAFFFKQSSGLRTEMGIQLDGEIRRSYPTPRVPCVPVG